ncbi:hypothetical protein [Streptomyces inhibens]|uniref:hypothetical protein n=1 Tax=Streptomyces inhibens TaxID=2293571 RepID=UPI003159E59C
MRRTSAVETREQSHAGEVLADNIVGAAVERANLRNADVNVSTQVLRDDPESVLLREADRALR